MIHLIRPNKDPQLDQNCIRLTDEFKKTGRNVWREDYIVNPLISMSHSAVYATLLWGHPHYNDLETQMRQKNLWDYKKMRQLEKTIKTIALTDPIPT